MKGVFISPPTPAAPGPQCQLEVEEVLAEPLNILVAGCCLAENNAGPN